MTTTTSTPPQTSSWSICVRPPVRTSAATDAATALSAQAEDLAALRACEAYLTWEGWTTRATEPMVLIADAPAGASSETLTRDSAWLARLCETAELEVDAIRWIDGEAHDAVPDPGAAPAPDFVRTDITFTVVHRAELPIEQLRHALDAIATGDAAGLQTRETHLPLSSAHARELLLELDNDGDFFGDC